MRRIPVTVEVTFEVTEYEPDTRYALRTTSGQMGTQGLHTLEVAEGATRVHVDTEEIERTLFGASRGATKARHRALS